MNLFHVSLLLCCIICVNATIYTFKPNGYIKYAVPPKTSFTVYVNVYDSNTIYITINDGQIDIIDGNYGYINQHFVTNENGGFIKIENIYASTDIIVEINRCQNYQDI